MIDRDLLKKIRSKQRKCMCGKMVGCPSDMAMSEFMATHKYICNGCEVTIKDRTCKRVGCDNPIVKPMEYSIARWNHEGRDYCSRRCRLMVWQEGFSSYMGRFVKHHGISVAEVMDIANRIGKRKKKRYGHWAVWNKMHQPFGKIDGGRIRILHEFALDMANVLYQIDPTAFEEYDEEGYDWRMTLPKVEGSEWIYESVPGDSPLQQMLDGEGLNLGHIEELVLDSRKFKYHIGNHNKTKRGIARWKRDLYKWYKKRGVENSITQVLVEEIGLEEEELRALKFGELQSLLNSKGKIRITGLASSRGVEIKGWRLKLLRAYEGELDLSPQAALALTNLMKEVWEVNVDYRHLLDKGAWSDVVSIIPSNTSDRINWIIDTYEAMINSKHGRRILEATSRSNELEMYRQWNYLNRLANPYLKVREWAESMKAA